MALTSGTRLGPYEILAPLGAGGMGEVYRARDTRLHREVAIKVLPERVAGDPDALARFEREARAIAALSHANILAIHDFGVHDGVAYAVTELLEGETLAEKLARGPLPTEALARIGAEICAALAAAHRKGIVHRDLKPSNVMLTKSGVKLLDFGLAKPFALDAEGLTSAQTSGPEVTREGSIVGTLSYMSPEQLEGRPVDARTDIFSLGSTLYEMATGKRPFDGRSQAAVVSAILASEPPPVSAVRPMSPPALDRLVRTCLAKDPDARWQTAHDVGLLLQGLSDAAAVSHGPTPAAPVRRRARWLPWLLAAAAAAAVVGTLAWTAGRRAESAAHPPRPRRLSVLPPEGAALVVQEAPAISPDGRRLAFVALDASGRSLIFVRSLDSGAATALPDTDDASQPFWSPDSRSLAFFARGKLKTIDANGGRSQTICDAPVSRGGTWNRDGTILFVPSPPQAPHIVPASGGEAKVVPALAGSGGSPPYRRSPYFLPDGRHYLYLSYGPKAEDRAICVGSLDSKDSRRLVSSQSSAAYADPGFLLFRRDASLMAQRFDPKSLVLSGEPFRIVPEVGINPVTLQTLFSASNDGTLTYITSGSAKTRLLWLSRSGREIATAAPPGYYNSLDLSPDGTRVAYDMASEMGNLDIFLMDLQSGSPSRFTFEGTTSFFPIWSPDGSRIVYSSLQGAPPNLYQKVTSGAGPEEPVLPSPRPQMPTSWSADGRFLVVAVLDPRTKWDIWVLPMTGDRKPFPFAEAAFDERTGVISPDGRWLAYASNESGNFEIYVRPFPAGPGRWQVSRDGGTEAHWRRDGRELYYLSGAQRIVAVEVQPDRAAFRMGAATPLFEGRLAGIESQNSWNRYAVTADGQRFLVNTVGQQAGATPIMVALDWPAELPK